LLTSSHSLLETGHIALIRNTAAQQLADVQKQHPDELFNLLTRVVPYLRPKSWETRAAAARAVGGIVDHAAKCDPNEDDYDVKAEPLNNGSAHAKIIPLPEHKLSFNSLNVTVIVRNGQSLLGTAGKEHDY
jgi:TATA-binding protein-associated factor